MRTPQLALGLRRRQRLDGSPFLAGVFNEATTIAAGTEVHLFALQNKGEDQPTHALRFFAPHVAPSRKALQQAAADRLDASAVRATP